MARHDLSFQRCRRAGWRVRRRPAVERTTAPPTKRGQAEPPEDRVFKAGSLGGPLYLFRRVWRGRVGCRPRRFTAWRFPCLRWNTNGNGHRLLFVESKSGKRRKNQKLKSKIARSEQQANLQLKYYKQLDANYQKSLQMIHDIDKHVNTIEQLYKSNEFEKADNYIKGMDRLISDFVLFPYSNNTVLNLILNEKKIFAEQHGILYKCTVEQTDFRFMDDIDITTIFSNLLENALSASALCKTNKEVSVIVSSHNNFVIINVKNSCNSYTKCGTFSSKDYGTGLYNVENSVKKYEGFLKISYSQTEFNCNVVLSNTH